MVSRDLSLLSKLSSAGGIAVKLRVHTSCSLDRNIFYYIAQVVKRMPLFIVDWLAGTFITLKVDRSCPPLAEVPQAEVDNPIMKN